MALKPDPSHPVHARVDDLDVELRAVPHRRRQEPGLGSRMAALGPWAPVWAEIPISIKAAHQRLIFPLWR